MLALSQAPIGTVTNMGCAGWPIGVPDSRSFSRPAGSNLCSKFVAALAGGSRNAASSMPSAMVSGSVFMEAAHTPSRPWYASGRPRSSPVAHYDCGMSEPRRRLSPDDRRSELLELGAKVFGERPYDQVRIDEIAERAGVSRALMYHYFPDKRAFFAAVVKAEGDRLFEATNTPAIAGQTLFEQLRAGVLAYLRYDEEHPHGAWAAY